ncbi:Pantetheine-phosphate adenylyltransferase [Hyphodiscus hymeniophilus]|uniref:Pantetheine-phosphate adenylyltransferase n=1 Tax=Hyphodiscus hymeniophilus TaxID=353542 RepID=A0A9P6VDA4_9HELO|nr:Pantetheine-phosphate adenylyltransferase [Hyphodiscus hymeniophilus]
MPNTLPSLLLLPSPPSPFTSASLSAAYRPSISATISAFSGLDTITQLIVALPCPSLHGRLHQPRSQVYEEVQRLVAGLYSLICAVCTKLGVDVDSGLPGSIDVRVLLLDYDSSDTTTQVNDITLASFASGPIVDLPTLALTRRRWETMFSVDGEYGQKLLSSFLDLANRISPPLQVQSSVVSGGVSMVQKDYISLPPTSKAKAHHVVAPPRRLIVGITGDELLKNKKYAEYLKPWKQRQNDVVEFLLSILSFTRSRPEEDIKIVSFDKPIVNGKAIHTHLKSCSVTVECVEIQDPFGPTITDEDVTALVVSGETRSGGKAVNEKRVEKGWDSLEVFEIDVLDAGETGEGAIRTDDFTSKISSTAIRKRKAENARTSSL